MLITDSQIHIWGADKPERPWPPDGKTFAHGPAEVTAEGVLAQMDKNGVARAILVPPAFEGDRNDLCLAAAGRYPQRFAVVGRVPLNVPDRARIKSLRAAEGVLGLRAQFNRGRAKPWLTDGTVTWLWEAAQDYDVPLYVFAPGMIGSLEKIVATYPRLRLAIDHLGLGPELLRGDSTSPIDQLLNLAKYQNVAVKASALPCYTEEAFPFRSLHGIVRSVVDAFGPRRVFWGSDLTRLPCSYSDAITLFTEAFDFLSTKDKEWIMGRSVSEWLRW